MQLTCSGRSTKRLLINTMILLHIFQTALLSWSPIYEEYYKENTRNSE